MKKSKWTWKTLFHFFLLGKITQSDSWRISNVSEGLRTIMEASCMPNKVFILPAVKGKVMDVQNYLATFQVEIERALFPRWASFKEATGSIAVPGPFCFPFPNDDLFRAFLIPLRAQGPLLLRFTTEIG